MWLPVHEIGELPRLRSETQSPTGALSRRLTSLGIRCAPFGGRGQGDVREGYEYSVWQDEPIFTEYVNSEGRVVQEASPICARSMRLARTGANFANFVAQRSPNLPSGSGRGASKSSA